MERDESMTTSVADIFSRSMEATGPHASSSNESGPSAAIGGFLICLDVPEATEFGVDYEVFRTGPKFQGVKFVPLGVHFVVFRSKDHEHGIRQGFFIEIKDHAQVVVREWSADNEELGPPRPGLNVEHLEKAVRSFQLDAGLGPYPKQHLKVWHRLSSYINERVLKRSGVEMGAIVVPGGIDDGALGEAATSGVVPFFHDQPRTARFTAVHQRDVAAMTPQERTLYYFDKSAMLMDLVATAFDGSWQDLLGEYQIAFIVFLQLSSLAALEQWKQITAMLCACESAVSTHAPLFTAFVRALRTQLQQIPVDFFDDELSEGNFLRPCLVSLLEILRDGDVPPELTKQRDRLSLLLQTRFHLTLDGSSDAMDTDEYAPTIVLPEELIPSSNTASNEAIAMAFLATQKPRPDHH